MERRELLELALDFAREAGLQVRREPSGAPVRSGVCLLRGERWIVLSGSDPLEDQLAVALEALRSHAGEALAERYVPPALRECLEG